MSVPDFYECTLVDVIAYLKANQKRQNDEANLNWAVMRWQSCMIANMMSNTKYKPTDLFILDGEIDDKEKRDPNSEKTKEILERMQKVNLKKWQQK